MSRRKPYDSKEEFVSKDMVGQEKPIIKNPQKVMLVKPAKSEAITKELNIDFANVNPSSVRPKIGRFFEAHSSLDIQEDVSSIEATIPEKLVALNDNTQVWDSKFALLLIALLVIVNLGLVTLLHHAPTSGQVASARHEVKELSIPTQPTKAITLPEASGNVQNMVPKAPVSVVNQSSVAPQQSTMPASPEAKQQLLSIIGRE